MPRKGGKSLSLKKKEKRASEMKDMGDVSPRDGGQHKENNLQGASGDKAQNSVKELIKDNAIIGASECSHPLWVLDSLPPVLSKIGKSFCNISGSIPNVEIFVRLVNIF